MSKILNTSDQRPADMREEERRVTYNAMVNQQAEQNPQVSSIAGKYDKASIEEKMKKLRFAKKPTEQPHDRANWFKQF